MTTRAVDTTLQDVLAVLRRGLATALLAAAVVAGIVWLLESRMPARYRSEAVLVVGTGLTVGAGTTFAPPPLSAASYSHAIASRRLVAQAAQALDGAAPTSDRIDELLDAIDVATEEGRESALLRIGVAAATPERAAALADALATTAVAWDAGRTVEALDVRIASLAAQTRAVEEDLAAAVEAGDDETAADLRLLRTELRGRRIEAQAERAGATGRLQRFEAATVPLRPFEPRPVRNAAIGAVLAVMLVYGALFLRTALRTNVADPDELARVTGLPVLATFPRMPSGRRRLPSDAAAYLRTAIEYGSTDVHPRIVLVTSAATGDGKSSVAIALASSFARRGDRTLLIDGDLRDPVLATDFEIDVASVPTLARALRDPSRIAPAHIDLGGGVGFDLIPGQAFAPGLPSSHNPTDLLSDGFAAVVARADELGYDVVVVDSAPILPVADALSIAQYATGAVLVARLPESDARSVRQALGLLERMRVPVFGAVATNVAGVIRRKPGAYGMGYRQAAVPDTRA